MGRNPKLSVRCGDDRISDLPDCILEHVLGFLTSLDAVRSSVLSRRWRHAWTYAHALNLSDEQLQDRFLGFASMVLARYGAADIPALNVTIGCESNLGPATTAWLRDAMERVVGSISVSVTASHLERLALPSRLRAKSISLTLNGIFYTVGQGQLVLPEPGGLAAFGGLTELSLSRVYLQEGLRPIGEFLSSCCPRLMKLRLSNVSGGLRKVSLPGHAPVVPLHWQLVLRLDLLEELDVFRAENLTKLEVVSANLRLLAVRSCFERDWSFKYGTGNVVDISAPRLEEIIWSGCLPNHLSLLNGSGCIRRLAGLCFFLPGKKSWSAGAARLLETCSSVDYLSVYVQVKDYSDPSDATRKNLEHVPQIPNVRVLSLHVAAILGFITCPIAPSIFSFLRRCPNLTRLHIDLSMLHRFNRKHPGYLVLPGNGETKAAKPPQNSNCDLYEVRRDQLTLSSLRDIRVSGFMGSDDEMEISDLVFGVGATRPALERISISLFPQLRDVTDESLLSRAGVTRPFKLVSASLAQLMRHMDAIGAKIKAQFPLVGGCWETKQREELTWTRSNC